MRIVLAIAWLLMLAACQEVEYCELCRDTDPALPVTDQNIPRVRILHGELCLPANATNVHHYMRCGIDCSQFIRFDTTVADARSFAQSLLTEHPLTEGANPWGANPWREGQPVWDRVIAFGWWPRTFPSDIEGGENTLYAARGPLIRIALLKRGSRARVWVPAYTT